MKASEYTQIVKQIENLKRKASEMEGARKEALKQIYKLLDVSSTKEAKKKIKELKALHSKLKKSIEDKYETFQRKYGKQLESME